MSYLLFINNEIFDIEPTALAQTKQVNDIGKISDRQTNYTNRFKAYRTARNIRNFQNLGLIGSDSNIPYQKNECSIYDADTGECIIYRGWANVNETTEDVYDIYIYDGIIDFYKAIENKNLSDVGISDLNHLKNLEGILDSWDEENNLPYRYMVADYGGKLLTDDSKINIDYWIPSALVKYLWDRIFDFFGFTYSGSIFQTEAFQNLWLTYPKPVGSESQQVEHIDTQIYTIPVTYVVAVPTEWGGINYVTYLESTLLLQCFSTSEAYSIEQSDGICRRFKVTENGLFHFILNGGLNFPNNPSANYGVALVRYNEISGITTYENIINGFTGPASINIVFSFNANTNERYGLFIMNGSLPLVLNSQYNPGQAVTGNLTIQLEKILGNIVNFENAFIDFQITDFFNEVLNQLGLTPFKYRFSRNVEFLTLSQRLQTSNVRNWTSKFSKKLPTKYVYGNYGQRNYFRYKYNDENANYNDGFFDISNKNIADAVTVFQSKIFTIMRL